MTDDFNFLEDWNFNNDIEPTAEPAKSQSVELPDQPKHKKTYRRKAACLELSERYLYRRAFSELTLLDMLPKELKEGHSIHGITAGDCDSLSYLKCILRAQPHIDHLLFSTWCMTGEDILQIDEWLEQGKIKKMDAYVGDIFQSSYRVEWNMIQDMFKRHQCGEARIIFNHSKIYAGTGPLFAFGIESSANINTNKRTENFCITIGQEIYDFYNDYFKYHTHPLQLIEREKHE